MSRMPAVLLFAASSAFSQEEPEIGPETRDGRLMYESWCARCHGADGRGEVEGIVLDTPVPDFTDCGFTSREPRKDWIDVVMHGGPVRGLSMTMPGWGEAISEEQARAIVAHMKTFCAESGWPQGELNFRRAQVTGKAFPENEALIIPTYTVVGEGTSRTAFVYESRFGPAGQWEIVVPLASRFGRQPVSGMGDIEIAGKYAFLHDEASLTIVSAGLEAGIPTGSKSNGFGGETWKLSPFVAGGKSLGPTFLQSSVKVERPLAGGSETELFYNLAWTIPLTDEKMGFFPAIELNGVTVLDAGRSTLFVTPQVYIGLVRRGHVALSLGAQVPVAGDSPFEYRIVSFILWEYADGGLWW